MKNTYHHGSVFFCSATDNRSCGSLGPTTGRSSSTASGHGYRGERHAHIVARHGWFQCAEGGVSAVARPTYVWFVPKVAPSKHWVAKILVEVLVAHNLADIGKKNELELARVHWHARKWQPSKQRPIFGS